MNKSVYEINTEKIAKAFLEYVPYKHFRLITYRLSGRKWLFSQSVLSCSAYLHTHFSCFDDTIVNSMYSKLE